MLGVLNLKTVATKRHMGSYYHSAEFDSGNCSCEIDLGQVFVDLYIHSGYSPLLPDQFYPPVACPSFQRLIGIHGARSAGSASGEPLGADVVPVH